MAKIKKIEIEVAGETLRLTPEQARELRDILSDIYPEDSQGVAPVYVPVPYPTRENWPYRRPGIWLASYAAGDTATLSLKAEPQQSFGALAN